MNDILRQTIYRMAHEARENEAQSKVASELEFDETFFTIDWEEYDGKTALMVKELLPLSVGINPAHRCARFDWIDKYESNTTGKAAAQIAEMLMRKRRLVNKLNVVSAYIEGDYKKGKPIKLYIKGKTNLEHEIALDDFLAFANDEGWELPSQLQRAEVAGQTRKAKISVDQVRVARRYAELKKKRVHAYTKEVAKEFGISTRYVTECVRKVAEKPPSGMDDMAKHLTAPQKKMPTQK